MIGVLAISNICITISIYRLFASFALFFRTFPILLLLLLSGCGCRYFSTSSCRILINQHKHTEKYIHSFSQVPVIPQKHRQLSPIWTMAGDKTTICRKSKLKLATETLSELQNLSALNSQNATKNITHGC